MARSFELRVRNLSEDVVKLRALIEGEYEIKLPEWGYDDATGVLVALQPTELKAVQSREALTQDLEDERSNEKKKRSKRKKKNNVSKAEEPIISTDKQKPSAAKVEA